MPLTDAQRRKLETDLSGGSAQSSALPGTLPPDIEAMIAAQQGTPGYLKSMSPRGGVMVPPIPSSVAQSQMRQQLLTKQAETQIGSDATTNRQLQKKAADQKLQLEQSLALFNKLFDEADTALPKIEQSVPGTLRFQQGLRIGKRELGFDEKARGTLQSFRARATPILKSLGEVGVLTNQDIERILAGGMPSDLDTTESRSAKREGILSDLQMKLNMVNQTLGTKASAGTTLSPEESDIVKRLLGQ